MPHGWEPPETIVVARRVVACDGDEGPLGHPRVYLNMGDSQTAMNALQAGEIDFYEIPSASLAPELT